LRPLEAPDVVPVADLLEVEGVDSTLLLPEDLHPIGV
jgi:hypothetical protein